MACCDYPTHNTSSSNIHTEIINSDAPKRDITDITSIGYIIQK